MVQNERQPRLPNLLTKAELAELLGVSTRTIDRLEERRKGPPRIKLGRNVFYREESVHAWLENQEQHPVRG